MLAEPTMRTSRPRSRRLRATKSEAKLDIEPHARCHKNSRAHQLYVFLREHRVSASPEEIAVALGITPSYARMLLWRESNFGQVKRSGVLGHYRYALDT